MGIKLCSGFLDGLAIHNYTLEVYQINKSPAYNVIVLGHSFGCICAGHENCAHSCSMQGMASWCGLTHQLVCLLHLYQTRKWCKLLQGQGLWTAALFLVARTLDGNAASSLQSFWAGPCSSVPYSCFAQMVHCPQLLSLISVDRQWGPATPINLLYILRLSAQGQATPCMVLLVLSKTMDRPLPRCLGCELNLLGLL